MSPNVLDIIGAKYDRGDGDNWSYKTCKMPVKSSPLMQHPAFLLAGWPFCHLTNSARALKEVSVFFLKCTSAIPEAILSGTPKGCLWRCLYQWQIWSTNWLDKLPTKFLPLSWQPTQINVGDMLGWLIGQICWQQLGRCEQCRTWSNVWKNMLAKRKPKVVVW